MVGVGPLEVQLSPDLRIAEKLGGPTLTDEAASDAVDKTRENLELERKRERIETRARTAAITPLGLQNEKSILWRAVILVSRRGCSRSAYSTGQNKSFKLTKPFLFTDAPPSPVLDTQMTSPLVASVSRRYNFRLRFES